ncbi:transglycosylase domain-containing protein [candidate division WWE3 bacterium]|nr:transglycosylase domain-containing protein [candidate division WWE3 bacterium]
MNNFKFSKSRSGFISKFLPDIKSRFSTRTSARKTFGKFSLLPTDSKKRRFILILLTYGISFALFCLVIGVLVVTVTLAIFSRDLPNPNTLLERSEELSTKITDRNGAPIYEVFGEKHRVLAKLPEISPDLVHATLAVEDSNFYSHQGVSFRGMLRAVKNMIFGGNLQSGSTLTQQVVKNALLTQEQTVTRKLKELILSLQLENRYTKDEILQMYLNETPYGGQNYGAYTASKAYFNKLPNELSMAESAFIAGLPQSPTRYSPFSSDPSRGLERKNYVLYLMKERGWLDDKGTRHFISEDEYKNSLAVELKFQPSAASFKAPHFVFFVREYLADLLGENVIEQVGLQVTTTLDLKMQDEVQQIVKDEVDSAKNLKVYNGSLVALDAKSGQILAMVGSKDYFAPSEPEGCTSGITGEGSCVFEPNLNVTLARRQPGSSIKPITYATMLEQGYSVAFPFLDVPTAFRGADGGKDYKPVNYDGKFRGVVPLRKALGNSLNIPAVKAVQMVGVKNMIKQASKMGISTFENVERYGPAITLGGGETKLLEMTAAYSVFASGGLYRAPTPILEIKNAKGDVIYSYRDNGGERVLSEETAYLISDILSDDGARADAFGSNSMLNIGGQEVAVKTGTTDDKRDNYALGFTKDVVVGAWVGNNNNEQMLGIASGISGATPIWRKSILTFLKDKKPNYFDPVKNVKKIEIDKLTGMLPYGDRDRKADWFKVGSEPTSVSTWYKRLEICEEDGRIANEACDNADQTETKTFIDIQAERPEWQDDVDNWVGESFKDQEEYFAPKMTSELKFDGDEAEKADPVVAIVNKVDGQEVPLGFRISAEVSSARDISKVQFYMDGNEVGSDKSYPYGYNFEFGSGTYGIHEFKVKAIDKNDNEGETSIRLNIVGFRF